MTTDSPIVRQLRGVAAKLTGDLDLQQDLLQEMLIHLGRVGAEAAGHTGSWYVKSCEFHARNYLDRGRSIDSLKRQMNAVPLEPGDPDDTEDFWFCVDAVDPLDLRSELITRDLIDLMIPQLTPPQHQVFSLLLHGFGIREIARTLRISHPMVINHRKKIAQLTSRLLADTGCLAAAA